MSNTETLFIDKKRFYAYILGSFLIGSILFGTIFVVGTNQIKNMEYDRGYEEGYNYGMNLGNQTGWVAGNTTGYINGYLQGYNDAFSNNQIRMIGNANSTINVYNSEQNSTYRTIDFYNLNNSDISSIDTYQNKTATITASISNIELFNTTIIQHNFTNVFDNYHQTNWYSVLYQSLNVEHRLNLTQISILGRIFDHAKLVISLYNDNDGFVGSLNRVLHTDVIGRPNGIQLIQINLTNIEIDQGDYFIAIDVFNGEGAFTIASSSIVNDYLTYCSFFFINELVQVDYAINYTIIVPNFLILSDFIDVGILNAYDMCKYVEIDFEGYVAQIYQFTLSGSIDALIQWHWYNVSYDLRMYIQFGIDTLLSYNSTLSVDAFSVMANQSVCFWGLSDGDFVHADVTYYTKHNIQAQRFCVIINTYSFAFDLPIPIPLLRANTYNYNIIEMNATIYNVIGTTWLCNFQMRANLNGNVIYNQINGLYLFEVFRV